MRTRFFGALAIAAIASSVGVLGNEQATRGGVASNGQDAAPTRTCDMVYNFPEFHKCAVENMGSFDPPRNADC